MEQYLREIQGSFPAGIKVHLIEEDQYKYHMAINANNNLHNLVIQHGLWIVERNLVKPGVVGRMFGDFGSPKLCMFAAIDINEHYKQGLGKKRYIYNTIVHEIFHALNVRHHGWTHKLVKAYRNTTQIAPGVTDEGTVALYNGVSSGDVSCVMSYGIALYYEESPGRIALYEDGWPKFFQFTIDKKKYSHLCSQKTGTGDGESFQLGPAERGECIKAVQISDK